MKNSVYLRLSSFLFTFFFCWLVFLAFMPIWFKQVLHLSGAQIGTIYAANAIAAMTFQPIYGYISDRIGLRKHLLGFINFCVAMTAPFFLLVYQPLLESFFFAGVVAGALFMAIAYNAGVAAIESFVEKAGRSNDFEFGRARCWGSLGAAVGIFAAGLVFNLNPSYIFILASIMSLPLAAILYTTRLKAADLEIAQKNNISLADVKALFKIKNVWLFMIFILGSACVYSVFDQQFAIYYASLFPTEAEGNEAFGYLNSFQVFLEAAAMFAAPYFVNKLGAKRSLILAGTIMTCRMVGSGVVVNTIGISAIKLLHAVELSLLLVAVFKYIAKNFDNRLASVMYLVGYQLSNQLGAAILSPVVGSFYDSIGFPSTYLFLGAVVGSFTLFGAFVLVSDSKAPYQQREEAESAPEAA
ncbi:MFS transporter [Veillonellaceae bacterium WCA-693-APC-5D-A]|uniref:MFS transporter n=1 Tax=Anaerovibrio slackiae TaxID=2652309 RepID=A0A6I2UA88_9FIRM|nr:oligosaccharide MFS transporter [Anaerovibrio slackiae]MCI6097350.1 oligosaccharide MFS transporter [Selenomonadaceae bacterium]MCI6484458.1 oligosaccharide MFS transporter [Selenomonadaceae bacterium]MSU08418.1 MFS transporter [Anaerovibrio slackiae]